MKWAVILALELFVILTCFSVFRVVLLSGVTEPNSPDYPVMLFVANNANIIAGLIGILCAGALFVPTRVFVESFRRKNNEVNK